MGRHYKGSTGVSLTIEKKPLSKKKKDCRNCLLHTSRTSFSYCKQHKIRISENHAKRCKYFKNRNKKIK